MNILKSLRKHWLWTLLCLLCFTISLTRNFPIWRPLSWWNVCWIIPLYVIGVFACVNSWRIFKPIRWIAWPGYRDIIEMRFKQLKDNPMVYPAILWLRLGDAEKAFITGGVDAFQAAFNKQTGKVENALRKVIETAVDKQPAGVHVEM